MFSATTLLKAALSGPTAIDFDVDDNEEYFIDNDHKIEYDSSSGIVNEVHLVKKNPTGTKKRVRDEIVASINKSQAAVFVGRLNTGHFPTYADVKTYDPWKNFYNIKLRTLRKAKPDFSGTIHESVESGACRRCLYVFPLRNLTIDHQNPQKGSGFLPLIKVFRGLGLTLGAPKVGGKNRTVYSKYGVKISNRAFSATSPASGHREKYTLSYSGQIYFSLIEALGELENLSAHCMNHYLNLSPMCNSCNSSKSNR